MVMDIELLNKLMNVEIRKPRAEFKIVSACQFTFPELTEIYNQTRVDYMVPMPMNEAKLRQYVYNYDIDLKQSVVAISADKPLGVAMLGVRGAKTWITRLGVTPHGRQRGIGRGLMEALISNARQLGARTVVLEVIKNNKPAEHLFKRLGFQMGRELLVIRRPPKPIHKAESKFPMEIDNQSITKLGHQAALDLLKSRTDKPSWVTDNQSLGNTGNLAALMIDSPNLGRGWLVYQERIFQLGRLILETEKGASLNTAVILLQNLHKRYSTQDTIVENLAADDRHWLAFQQLGYMTSFVRVEMKLALTH